jgi:hypothetical protein
MSSTPPEPELDLEKLFLPAWAQDSSAVNKYANFAGDDRPPREHGERMGGRRPPRRDGGPAGPRGRGPSGPSGPRQDRGPRPGGPRPGGRPFDRNDGPRPPREAPAPLPQINVTILPDDKGVESLARQIRMTGRAYPLFDIAQLILQRPERQQIRFDVIKNPEGQPLQLLFLCGLDDTLWLSEDEAVQHLLNRHFATFYQAERTATEPPRGTYTFVAQCGMSGTVLGPPNHHDYQNQLRKLHAERFSRMPFEAFKNRVKIVKDEAVVKKWIEDQSFKTEYNCLNMAEPLKLNSREEVEKHFRQVHLANLVKPVESHTTTGAAARQLRSPELQRLMRVTWEEQRRFPLKVATTLSQQFASHGLQFFKVNRTVTHVSVARPHYLDLEATPVSEGVKRIVEFINKNPKCTRRKLMDALAPGAAPAAPAPAPADPAAPTAPVESTPEQTALAGDLHWLIHEGHVIEFANGLLDTAKKPAPRPVPVKKEKPAAAPAAGTAPAEGSPTESAPGGSPEASSAVAPSPETSDVPSTAPTLQEPAAPVEIPGTAA